MSVDPVVPTRASVLAVLGKRPRKIGELGLDLLGTSYDGDQPIGAHLASLGLSLSALQSVVDELVRSGAVVELRGRALWDRHLDGLGPEARGRHFARA